MTVMFKELVLEADEQNRWIAKLMSSSDQETPDSQVESQSDIREENYK